MLKLNSKLLAILLSVLLVSLSGCVEDSVDVKQMRLTCTDRGGVNANWLSTVQCNDGSKHDFTKTILPKELWKNKAN